MSATDITTAIYYKYMGFDPENLDDPNRDRFILSKGHNGVLLYTIFCDMGIYDLDLLLDTYNTIGHPFGAHPNHKRVKGIEVSSGSLGHGLNWCCGIAHANADRGIRARIWTLLGDGEMEEGSNWEGILYAASHNLGNIVAVVDFNHASAAFEMGQNNRWGRKGGPEGMADCFRAFGWNAAVIDGTRMAEIDKALSELPEPTADGKGTPTVIISSTMKGQGVRFMEERPCAYHIAGFDDEHYELAIRQIREYTAERLAEV